MATYTEQENQWTVTPKISGEVQTKVPLVLEWEADYASVSDDYTTREISAYEMFQIWAKKVETRHGDTIPIFWVLLGERAPFCEQYRNAHKAEYGEYEDFTSYYRRPVNTETGEPVNWARIPVAVGTWAPGETKSKSDFIVTATGWVPSPLQSSVSLAFLIDCANAQAAANGYDE
ncbi:hypothetical protein [Nocardia xishanensis]|uniref:hypothetical protein n=1 Tax=Nocardia xishanensis TaxID=238964 RepID=UPI000835DB81|nr:hypothetical protein [Nocardia xishanensis]